MRKRCDMCLGLGWILVGKVLCTICRGLGTVEEKDDD